MTSDPLAEAVELLERGHSLYGASHFEAGVSGAPEQLTERADGLTSVNRQMAAQLRRGAAADSGLAAALAAASSDHAAGRRGTRRVLDEARNDSMPAADTPLGQQEALGRMATRLRRQRHYLNRSHRSSHLLAGRLRRLAYPRRLHTFVPALPASAVRYEKTYAPGHVRRRIAAALDHLGIIDPAARRNWIRGYETLIARESGGRASAVQPDGPGLGITQTIPATFAHYHQPGTSTNIYDPVANICASMNYVIHRYGAHRSGDNLATMVQQADAHRPPKGY